MSTSAIKLQSSDHRIFYTDLETVKCSGLISDMLKNLGDNASTIPLPNVDSETLRLVIDWAAHHKNDQDDGTQLNTEDISQWDAKFLEVEQRVLFNLIMAANFLNIRNLMHVTCKTMAKMIKGKSPEELRRTFGIINDFDDENAQP